MNSAERDMAQAKAKFWMAIEKAIYAHEIINWLNSKLPRPKK